MFTSILKSYIFQYIFRFMYKCLQWRFFKKNEGGKGAEFAKYFRRNRRVLDKCFGIFVNYTYFSREKAYKKVAAQAKSNFLI